MPCTYDRVSGQVFLPEQERGERLRARAEAARAARHARVLRRFWHTSSGLVWQVLGVWASAAAERVQSLEVWATSCAGGSALPPDRVCSLFGAASSRARLRGGESRLCAGVLVAG